MLCCAVQEAASACFALALALGGGCGGEAARHYFALYCCDSIHCSPSHPTAQQTCIPDHSASTLAVRSLLPSTSNIPFFQARRYPRRPPFVTATSYHHWQRHLIYSGRAFHPYHTNYSHSDSGSSAVIKTCHRGYMLICCTSSARHMNLSISPVPHIHHGSATRAFEPEEWRTVTR